MQKKVFLSVVMSACLMGGVTTVFNACSNDEVEEQQLESKADYLRAKAKEFSKKYGVDMSLNEENMDIWAETLTVEQLEADFQAWATLKGKQLIKSVSSQKPIKKGIKIRTTKTAEEIRYDVQTGSSCHFVSCRIPCYRCHSREYDNFGGDATVRWTYDPSGVSKVSFDVDLYATFCSSHFKGSADTWDSVNFYTTTETGDVAFTAYGNVKLVSENYVHTRTISISVLRTDGVHTSLIVDI